MYGVGVDIVRIARVSALADRYKTRFLQRAFHPNEIEAYQAALRPAALAGQTKHADVAVAPLDKRLAATYLASRWAAKEAFIKALRTQRPPFHLVEVGANQLSAGLRSVPLDAGAAAAIEQSLPLTAPPPNVLLRGARAPAFVFHGDAAAAVAATGAAFHLSLSHDGEYAIAVVTAWSGKGADAGSLSKATAPASRVR
jgi:phosphopantetheine--protein transferase-like protein